MEPAPFPLELSAQPYALAHRSLYNEIIGTGAPTIPHGCSIKRHRDDVYFVDHVMRLARRCTDKGRVEVATPSAAPTVEGTTVRRAAPAATRTVHTTTHSTNPTVATFTTPQPARRSPPPPPPKPAPPPMREAEARADPLPFREETRRATPPRNGPPIVVPAKAPPSDKVDARSVEAPATPIVSAAAAAIASPVAPPAPATSVEPAVDTSIQDVRTPSVTIKPGSMGRCRHCGMLVVWHTLLLRKHLRTPEHQSGKADSALRAQFGTVVMDLPTYLSCESVLSDDDRRIAAQESNNIFTLYDLVRPKCTLCDVDVTVQQYKLHERTAQHRAKV